MNNPSLRPWGRTEWLFNKLPTLTNWSFLSCLSTEERCLTSFRILSNLGIIQCASFFKIIDPPSNYSNQANTLISKNLIELNNLTTKIILHKDFELFDPVHLYIDYFEKFIANGPPNLAIDISTFPKRFFFPLLKIAFNNKRIENLIITYTIPKSYSSTPLAEDFSNWTSIPTFGPVDFLNDKTEIAIVGIGYMPFGLPNLLKDKNIADVRTLLPFPPGSSGHFNYRNWLFIEELSKVFSASIKDPIRVDPIDVSSIYDCIVSQTDHFQLKTILAPFGPKPMSVAMCIYACISQTSQFHSPVYYSQPSHYNPLYSTGVSTTNGDTDSYSYCIRLCGRDLYTA